LALKSILDQLDRLTNRGGLHQCEFHQLVAEDGVVAVIPPTKRTGPKSPAIAEQRQRIGDQVSCEKTLPESERMAARNRDLRSAWAFSPESIVSIVAVKIETEPTGGSSVRQAFDGLSVAITRPAGTLGGRRQLVVGAERRTRLTGAQSAMSKIEVGRDHDHWDSTTRIREPARHPSTF
jgi:hypothetical protein